MFSRREFLATSGLVGVSMSGMCRPVVDSLREKPGVEMASEGVQGRYIKQRSEMLEQHDPKIFLGYPANLNIPDEGFFAWRRQLQTVEIGQRTVNNVGDPFRRRGVGAAHMLEADLIETFAGRYGFSAGDVWGIVSNSGTDSNLHGAYIGRTLLYRRHGVQPKIYYTREAHYSIQIVRDLLGMDEVMVAATAEGSMDLPDLKRKLAEHSDAPALIIATIGTTFKGAVDDIDGIQAAARGHSAYVHLDAALFGGYLHVTEFADQFQQFGPAGGRYDSLAVSCHKFPGYPGVAGLFMMNGETFEEFRNYFADVHDPAYISHVPGTITCSRDAIKAAECHYFCTPASLRQQARDAEQVLTNAQYLHSEMLTQFPQLKPRRVDARSNIVYFDDSIAEAVRSKWHLATVRARPGHTHGMAHVVVMPHADKQLLDQFLEDLDKHRQRPAPPE